MVLLIKQTVIKQDILFKPVQYREQLIQQEQLMLVFHILVQQHISILKLMQVEHKSTLQ